MENYHGTVARWVGKQAFGFIIAEDGNEYFVHKSQCPDGQPLLPGDRVEFAIVPSPKGPVAVDVSVKAKKLILQR